ncbi:glycosyltransferase family 2 protein [Marivivens donghaensis]|jgi:GT2 family glycosyltransferase|uniref:glycosyltransferase family 2 protein n=1 Tax=Marivivens donghaensis TaxID=1699413 RepID=UPI003F69B1DA
MIPTIAVLLTCFNRRAKTLAALEALFKQDGAGTTFTLNVFLVDDGSTDGTGDAVRGAFPQVHAIDGTGDLYWNGGMRRAFEGALEQSFDYMLWLNDDTDLNSDAILRLLETSKRLAQQGKDKTAVFGSTCDPQTGDLTYGGFQRRKGPILRLQHVGPDPKHPREVTTMAGNCALVCKAAVDAVGNLEPRFFHAWGDVDYGMRLRDAGGSVWLTPGYLAQCDPNPAAQRWRDDPSLSLRDRLAHLNSFRGLYPPDWLLFMRRHGGLLWPLAWAIPYVQLITRHLRFKLSA